MFYLQPTVSDALNFRRCPPSMWSVGCLQSFWRQESKITSEIRAWYKSWKHRSHRWATCPCKWRSLEGMAFFFLLNLPRWPISDWKFGTTLLRFLQFSLIDQVMNNREVVDVAKRFKDPYAAAKQLTAEALKRDSKDDISCIVVRFKA